MIQRLGRWLVKGGDDMGGTPVTGKQRMEAAFRGEKLDRVPVFLILGAHLADRAGFTLQQALTDPEAALKTAQLTSQEIASDMGFVPFNPFMPDAQEAIRQLMGKLPSIKRPDIKEKLPRWHVRDVREDKLFAAHLDVCQKTVALFPDRHIETLIGGPWSFALELRGMEEAMEDIYEDKAFLHDLMRFTTDTVIARSLAVVEMGIIPFVGDPSAGMSVISPAVYREFVRPYHKQVVDAIHEKGGRVVFHICGYVDPIMEDLVSLGVDGLSIDGPSSLEKMFAAGRGKTLIIGNVDPMLFVEGTFDQLEAKVTECLAVSQGEARYAFAPGCQIPLAAPLENVKHFVHCCHKHGTH
jgi:uroporphyrinogen decarboxylase